MHDVLFRRIQAYAGAARRRRLIRRGAAIAALAASWCAYSDQYQSETKELEQAPPQAQKQDPQQLLQQTTDPYAKALLLRDLAMQAAERKDYAGAAKYLEEALGQNSLSGPAAQEMRNSLTQLYLAGGKPADVIRALERTVGSNPKASPEQMAALGGAYAELKRYKDAIPLLQRAVAASPKPEESWLQALYASMVGAGQEKEAAPVLEKLVRVNPAKRDYWLQLIATQMKAGNKDRALALMELASRQGYLDSADERLQLVSLTSQQGAPFEAGSLMQGWMQSGQIPKTAQNWEVLAGLWVNAREAGLAVAALDEAVKESPKSELYLQLGQLRMRRGEYAQAAYALDQGLQRGNRTGPALLMLGNAYFQQNKLDAAKTVFQQATQFPATKKPAEEWLAFLSSDTAKEQARLVAERKPAARPVQVALSSRLLGSKANFKPPVTEAMPATAGAPAAPNLRTVGGRLTPVGAERDGSADGTIPAWDGGLQKAQWPASYKPGGRIVDPYPNDRPLFTITVANAAQYGARLTDSYKALMSKYPDYKMPVYPTRRSVSYPQAIYDATQANIGKAKLIGSDALQNAHIGFPFPLPQNGVEVMWNHRTRFRGNSVQAQSTQAVVTANGGIQQMLKQTERVFYRYSNTKDPVDIGQQNILLYYLTWFSRGGGNDVDFLALAHETANSMQAPRAIWVLPPGIRKMFRVPPVGYDQPFPGSEAIQFIDMIDMYNGAFDRYVWKLTGKRELYIPYNSYRISDGRVKYQQLLTPKHINQDNARYELHRVWVIEATERGGMHHSFGKRVFYVDEDSWNVVLVENYDHEGHPWRFQEGHLLPIYEAQTANCMPVVTYDLKDGRYFANRLIGEDPPPRYDMADINAKEFLPDAVKNRYSR